MSPQPSIQRAIEITRTIAADMKADATNFDGQPFNGRTVAEYFGNQGAAIAALADIVEKLLLEQLRADAPERPTP